MKIRQRVGYKPLVIIIFLSLVLVQVYLLNSISTYGSRLNLLEKDISSISKENEDLEEVIASSSSVTTISAKAHLLGLTTNPTTLSMQSPLPLALSNLNSN